MVRKLFLGTAGLAVLASAAEAANTKIGDVFVIAMENQNSSVSGVNASGLPPIYGDTSAAPYINSLITPGNANAKDVSYSGAYHDIIVNPSTDLHPSEPNYIYQISGQASEAFTDAVPNAPGDNNYFSSTTANLGQSLNGKGLTWKSYQEDMQIPGVTPAGGVPNQNASGQNASYVNPYNGTDYYNYAAKHNPFVFFAGDQQPANYAPLTQLQSDLNANSVANFNWITPDQYNDMHTALPNGFTYNGQTFTGDQANIAQGDNFLSQIVPMIEASQAFKNNGLIVIWTDENEGDTPATNSQYDNMEILISPLSIGNAYSNTIAMNHNTDLNSYLQLFGLSGSGYPTAVTSSNTFSSLLQGGALGGVPEPATWAMMLIGFGAIGGMARRRTGAARA